MVNDLKDIMKGTGSMPFQYKIGSERHRLREIRRDAEDGEKALAKIEEATRIADEKKVNKEMSNFIKKLNKIAYSTQVAEMRMIERCNDVGDLLLKKKVEAPTEFISARKTIKELTRHEFDLARRALGRESASLALKLKLISPKRVKARLDEIQLWRRQAAEQVKVQKKMMKEIKKDKFEGSIKDFSDAVIKEMKLLNAVLSNCVTLFIEMEKRLEELKSQGFSEDKVIGIKNVIQKEGSEIAERSEIPAFRMAGNTR